MRKWLIWIGALFVFGQFYAMVAQKEALRHGGQEMFLKLAPRDPTSYMQGDYMELNYDLTNKLYMMMRDDAASANLPSSGAIVVRLDDHQVAEFVRLDTSAPLSPGEHLLHYRRDGSTFLFGVERYFIPEGTGGAFKDAVYGDVHVSLSGDALLVDLRDKDFQPLVAPAN
jgi:uncharacterized membrane-anchored protein